MAANTSSTKEFKSEKAKLWHFNILLNEAKTKYDGTPDTKLSRNFADFLVKKVVGWGFDQYFDPSRNALPGTIFYSLFRLIKYSTFTFVIITKEYRQNKWLEYCCDVSLVKRLNNNDVSYKNVIGILVGVPEEYLPQSLIVNAYVSFTDNEDEWKENANAWNRLHDLMGNERPGSSPPESGKCKHDGRDQYGRKTYNESKF